MLHILLEPLSPRLDNLVYRRRGFDPDRQAVLVRIIDDLNIRLSIQIFTHEQQTTAAASCLDVTGKKQSAGERELTLTSSVSFGLRSTPDGPELLSSAISP